MDDESNQERVLSIVAHQPRHIMNGMITVDAPVQYSTEWRSSPSSTLGDLDALPLEVLHIILMLLDFRTLSDITKTCLRGIEIVTSLPQFRDIMRHAPKTPVALAKTGLIRHHVAMTLHSALLSASCISCNNFAPFLFLLTCERCCYHCLWRVQTLWAITIPMARKCFGISANGLKTLKVMHSIPGHYWVKHSISRQRPVKLVCAGSAKELAKREGRTEERMAQDLEELRHSAGLSLKEYSTLRFLQRPPIRPPDLELLVHPTEAEVPSDMFCGMSSMPFPSLGPDNIIEHGLWCLGCEEFWRHWSKNDPLPGHLMHLMLPGCLAADVVHNIQEVARSKVDFMRHVLRCPGAKAMLEQADSATGTL